MSWFPSSLGSDESLRVFCNSLNFQDHVLASILKSSSTEGNISHSHDKNALHENSFKRSECLLPYLQPQSATCTARPQPSPPRQGSISPLPTATEYLTAPAGLPSRALGTAIRACAVLSRLSSPPSTTAARSSSLARLAGSLHGRSSRQPGAAWVEC